ncbi:Ig-like domain-containing protein [Actinoplanes xinjiangensis]|uniref:Ig-like domain-containing protein n=1 Tax=Actinoplanes xinjiangensis TaxID=512350 RepID=UPI00343BB559
MNRNTARRLALSTATVVAGAAVVLPLAPALAAALPDLRATVSVSPAKASYQVGDQVSFTFTVHNAGDAAAVAARLEGGDEDGVTRLTDPPGEQFDLAPGAERTLTWDGTIDQAGAVAGAAYGAWTFTNDAGEAEPADNTARYQLAVPGLTGTLTVKTFADLMGNHDSRQRGTSGVGLTLTRGAGSTVATAVTDASGIARFTDVPAGGDYALTPAGWVQRGVGGNVQVMGGQDRSVALALEPGSGPPDARPTVTSTGLTEGQLVGTEARITPVTTDDVGVTKVEVLVDGVVSKVVPGPDGLFFTLPGRVHDAEVVVTVRAHDADGNIGEAHTRVRMDVRFPQVTLSPAEGTALRGVVTLQVTSTDTDVVEVDFRDILGRHLGVVRQAPWTVSWDTRGLPERSWVQVNVTDRAGNVSGRMSQYNVNPAGPVISSITPAHGALVRGSVRTTVKAGDPSGIRFAYTTGGIATGTSSPYTFVIKPKAQGPFTFQWIVVDGLGNRTVASRTVVNDTVRPTLRVTKAPKKGAKLTKSVTVTAAAADRYGVARVQLLVNGKVVATDTKAGYAFRLNPKRYGKKFTVQIRAYDRAGNVTTTSRVTYRR